MTIRLLRVKNFEVSQKLKLLPRDFLKVVFFHPAKFVPKEQFVQWVDYLLGILRKLRFRLNGRLPYNENWIEKEIKYVK